MITHKNSEGQFIERGLCECTDYNFEMYPETERVRCGRPSVRPSLCDIRHFQLFVRNAREFRNTAYLL